jgi:hypothetical protein
LTDSEASCAVTVSTDSSDNEELDEEESDDEDDEDDENTSKDDNQSSEDDDPFGFLDNLEREIEGQGESCEIRSFDSLLDATGRRLVLQTEKKSDFLLGQNREEPAALVLTQIFDPSKKLSGTILEIRSRYIKEALQAVIKTYPRLNIDSGGHIIMYDEPRCLFHYREELEQFATNSDDLNAQHHISFCLQYMATTLQADISAYDTMINANPDSVAAGLDFERLWMAYKPGELFCHNYESEEVISELVAMRRSMLNNDQSTSQWQITMQRLECNGLVLGFVPVYLAIPLFDGFRVFHQLNVFPLEYH